MLEPSDHVLRGILTQMIAELGHAPPLPELAKRADMALESFEESLQRLHDAHALLLHPNSRQPWVVHPFALSAGSCWVHSKEDRRVVRAEEMVVVIPFVHPVEKPQDIVSRSVKARRARNKLPLHTR